jgi:DNA repair photolyase
VIDEAPGDAANGADEGSATASRPREVRRGRGATLNPGNRFRDATREAFDDGWDPGEDDGGRALRTIVAVQPSRTIISRNQSPDIPFTQSINPYQGCEHGCVYCYARPTHAYHDLSPGLDFESRIFAKPNAAELLRAELSSPGYVCDPIAIGMNTDAYQPIEREWKVTRSILEVLCACEHPFSLISKSALVERDLDLIAPMAAKTMARAYFSITTLDRTLSRRMEPRAAAPQRRLEAVRRLADAGVPVGVMVAPVIPQLNDRDLEAILEAAAEAGARYAGYVMLRLPLEVSPLFRDWLDAHYPDRAAHVMSLVRQTRGGRDYRPQWGTRMRGEGVFADLIARRFAIACRRLGLNEDKAPLDTSRFRPPVMGPTAAPPERQLDLF